jgi:hypothetical protein
MSITFPGIGSVLFKNDHKRLGVVATAPQLMTLPFALYWAVVIVPSQLVEPCAASVTVSLMLLYVSLKEMFFIVKKPSSEAL